MSTPSAPLIPTAGSAGTAPIDAALEPASVRNGSPAVQKAYAGALSFEGMLVQQLSQSLSETSGLGGGGEEGSEGNPSEGSSAPGGDAVGSELSSLLPQTLANGVMSQGGLGLAQQLMGSLLPAGTPAPPAAGAVTAAGGSPADVHPLTPSGGSSASGASAPNSSTGTPAVTTAPRVASNGGVAA